MSMILCSWLCWVSVATTDDYYCYSMIVILSLSFFYYVFLQIHATFAFTQHVYCAFLHPMHAPIDTSCVFRRSMLLGRDGKVPTAESVRVPFHLHWFPWQLAGSRAHVWALKQRDSLLRISQSGKHVVPRVGLYTLHCSSCLMTMMCMLMDETFPFAAAFWVETAPARHSVRFLCCFGLAWKLQVCRWDCATAQPKYP